MTVDVKNGDGHRASNGEVPRRTLPRGFVKNKIRWHVKTVGVRSYHRARRSGRFTKNEFKYTWAGFTRTFELWSKWATCEEDHKLLNEKNAAIKAAGGTVDTKERKELRKEAKYRLRTSLAVFLSFLVLVALGTLATWLFTPVWQWWVPIGLTALVFMIFEITGHVVLRNRAKKGDDATSRPVTPLAPGVSLSKLQASIVEILSRHKTPVKLSFHGTRWLDHGVELTCHTTDPVTDDHLRSLERHLQTGHNMVSTVRDRDNAATPTLRLFWRDPLAGVVTPPRHDPKSLTCRDPLDLTRTDEGGRGHVTVLGVHVLIVGGTGSGKSSGIWTILDKLVDCYDAEVDGIDLTYGPALGAYSRVMRKVAYSEDDARVILDEALDLIRHRNAVLNEGIDADDDDVIDENWQVGPGDDEKARFVVIDEYTTLAQDDDLRSKAEEIWQTGRKARVTLVVGTPSSNKTSAKSTVPVNQSMVKIAFRTPFTEIKHVLGPGMSDEGWRPDKFEPQINDQPMDAGKSYIHSGEHGKPYVHRFDRLSALEIKARNKHRLAVARRAIATSDARFDPESAPDVLQLLSKAFKLADWPKNLPTTTILSYDDEDVWDPKSLADGLRPFNITRTLVPGPNGRTRGYVLEDLERVVRVQKDSGS